MGHGRRAVAALAALLLAGCFEGERVITVRADGAGSIEDTLTLGRQMRALMLMASRGEDAAERETRLAAAAAAMGPGVRAVSETLSGNELKAVYAFDDIARLELDAAPGPPEAEGEADRSRQARLRFRFERDGESSRLTVVQPRPAAAGDAEAVEGDTQDLPDLVQGMWGMMKGTLKGLKLRTRLVVDGEIVASNAEHRQGSAVTLLELDFDTVAADAANFERFTRAGGDPASMDPALLRGVAGIKVNTEPEVTIEFRER